MNGVGNEFHPSIVEDVIYKLINTEEHTVSSSEYDRTIGPEIMTYLESLGIQFNIIEDPYPNMTGASVSICWIEVGYLHHIVLNIRY